MTIHYDDLQRDLETDGRVKSTVVGVRYVGNRSSMSPNQARTQAGWPGDSPFQGGDIDPDTGRRTPGPWQIGICPDWLDDETVDGGTVSALENNANFEVTYEPEDLAAALLERNFLPPSAFGGEGVSYEPEVRQALFDALGLEDMGTCPAATNDYRKALAEIAGVDDVGEETLPEDKQRTQRYVDTHTRDELKDAVDALRESPEEISLRGGKTKFAEWLAQQPPEDVNAELDGGA